MQVLKKLIVAALVVLLPLASQAQTAPAAEAPKPPEDVIKVTPYGFVLLNAFWDSDTFTTRDYPGQVAGTNAGGAFLMSARQSRFGVRLAGKDTSVTGADLSGVIEFDFKAGHINTISTGAAGQPAAGTVTTPSTTWYNGVMRLRLAAATATWTTGFGKLSVLAGQEYGLVNPLFAESLAWVADPLFWQAGNLWRRAPVLRASVSGAAGPLGLTATAGIISPADGFAPVDNGAGNASRQPDIEARLAGNFKEGAINATVGAAGSFGKRRFAPTSPAAENVTVRAIGVDADVNVPYAQLKGEWYTSKGMDDSYNGIFSPGVGGAAGSRKAIGGNGYWAQAILKPLPAIWVTAGYGIGEAKNSDLVAVAAAAGTRKKNTQMAAGVIVNAGKWWRFGVEAVKVETTTFGNSFNNNVSNKDDATQLAVSSMLRF